MAEKKILIIDDDDSILDAISLILQDDGYLVGTASRGEDAYKKVIKHNPDIILLDYLMSGVNGRDICIKLKKSKRTAKIPVIMFSAHPSAKQLASDCGAEGFLTKPFERAELLALIEELLSKK
jgi:DNA-binding response OmpR family regulator